MQVCEAIERMTRGGSLGYEDTREMFARILRNEESAMEQGAFLAVMTMKGADIGELAAIRDAVRNVDTVTVEIRTDRPLCDNCGSGADTFKTFNISTAAAITAACLGAAVARHGSRSITSGCGTVDLCEALGIDVSASPLQVAASVESCGLGLFNGNDISVHPTGLFRILSDIHFGTVLNNAASMASPASPQYGLRGVNDPALLTQMARLMKRAGYRRAMTVFGKVDGTDLFMDEASTLGETLYVMIDEHGKVTEGSFRPQDMGLPPGRAEDVTAWGSVDREAERMRSILRGEGSRSCRDIAALNCGLLLFTAGLAPTAPQGVAMALETLGSGRCLDKLEEWRRCQ
ncbi:MAG: anthranilate phosphoribosyltransferase [Firmicutes bacterium]|nr:anthranilate phosphoribosyltransferase [Bacillota bacterium]